MDKEEALAALRKQREGAKTLSGRTKDSAEFAQWRRETRAALKNVFPTHLRWANELAQIRWAKFPGRVGGGLDAAKGLLDEAIAAVNHWEVPESSDETDKEPDSASAGEVSASSAGTTAKRAARKCQRCGVSGDKLRPYRYRGKLLLLCWSCWCRAHTRNGWVKVYEGGGIETNPRRH
ncbi:MAG: hypothetical protein GXY76_12025 [Chloroflexi bacterium]|nr:hypothetical protein [Chloroflexota bacterium]